MKGYLPILQFLLEQGTNIDETTLAGWTPVHYAAKYNQLQILKYLIQRGANKDFQDNKGNTALHYCTQAGYKMIVKYLIEQKANKLLHNKWNKLPIDLTTSKDIVALLQ